MSGWAQLPAPATPTLQTSAQLVVEDVVVTDKAGRPVHGLQGSDFTLRENGAPQTLRGFDEHVGGRESHIAAPPLPAGAFTNVPVMDGVANVLLLDGMNTPPESQPYLRDQLVRFLAAERPGTRTAVFTLNQSLRMLQDFTIDPALLRRVVKLQGVQFSPLLNRELNDTDAHRISETLSDLIDSASSPDMARMLEEIQKNLLDMEARRASQQVQIRARVTMDALNQLARYLAGVPGRKNVLWFSGSFPITIMREVQTTGDPFAGQADLSDQLRRTTNLLAANRVAVYPIDARGLEPAPSQSSAENGFTGNRLRTQRTYGTTAANPRDSQFSLDQAMEHSTMQELAQGTGGEAYYNTNGLQEAMERSASDGSNYYTLQYTPPFGTKPGEVRKIDIKLNKSGARLSYRRTYYTTAPRDAELAVSPIPAAARYSAPDASELAFQLQPEVVSSAPPDKIIGAKSAGTNSSLYALQMLLPVSALHVTQDSDGKHRATLEYATLLYDSKGTVLDSHQDRAALQLDEARYQAMLQGGLRFHHTVALPAGSTGSVRVLVRDVGTNRIGSLRLSDEEIRRAAAHAGKP